MPCQAMKRNRKIANPHRLKFKSFRILREKISKNHAFLCNACSISCALVRIVVPKELGMQGMQLPLLANIFGEKLIRFVQI